MTHVVEKDEIEAWQRQPVTQWLMDRLRDRCPCDLSAFRAADGWDRVNRIKGQSDVMAYLNDPMELWRLDQ